MSVALSMFKDAKLDELVNLYTKGSQTERDNAYDILSPIYPTEQDRLNKIKKALINKFNKNMIESLHISNYALIDCADINFNEGFNIITGETGAGKSIILGALSLILGGRADTKVVRDINKKSIIEATFSIKNHSF